MARERLQRTTGFEASPESPADDAFEEAIRALSGCDDHPFAKAFSEGLVDRAEVIDWVERVKRVLLFQCDRSELRAEVPTVAGRLEGLLRQVELPDGADPVQISAAFVRCLAELRTRIAEDVEAAFAGDPAAKGFAEIVLSYPSVRALVVYRVAHELYELGVPLLPRIMTEYAHDGTGIDIHPGARIGRSFFIDHGTGVVIGETAQVGDRVRIYQGVTLGALSIRHGENLRGRKRHPTIEDDVVIYAGAKILGGDTVIGRGSVIGGNVWLTESVPAGSKVIAEPARQMVSARGPEHSEANTLQLHWDI